MCSTWSASSSSTPPQAEVGRRTGELCQLCWDCLAFEETIDEAGQPRSSPMLVHDMPKVGVRGYRLPVGQAVVAVVRAQQARVQARYPSTPTSLLALFPSATALASPCTRSGTATRSATPMRGPGRGAGRLYAPTMGHLTA